MENIANILTKEQLVELNERMLGRGAPTQDDGVGYNKADFGACRTYYGGLSDAQYADLSKRLVKYSKTQLDLDKDMMKETAKHYADIAGGRDRSDGISLDIRKEGTLISFRYNEAFIDVIRVQPKRQWDGEAKNWIVPNGSLITVLLELEKVGADVEKAIEYANEHEFVKNSTQIKSIVNIKKAGDFAFVSFKYNPEIVEAVKELPRRKYNPDNRTWIIPTDAVVELESKLSAKCEFKAI